MGALRLLFVSEISAQSTGRIGLEADTWPKFDALACRIAVYRFREGANAACVVATESELDGLLSPPFWLIATRLRSAGRPPHPSEATPMEHITTKDGTKIFYKDWGPKDAQPIVFHHGWPLSADDWDAQMMFFLGEGLSRHRPRPSRTWPLEPDRRRQQHGHLCRRPRRAGRPSSTLSNAIHVGHSTGGGEVTRYVARARAGRVAKAVLIGAVPPVMVKKEPTPAGRRSRCSTVPRRACRQRAQFYFDFPTGPFYGFNRLGAKVSRAWSAIGGGRA